MKKTNMDDRFYQIVLLILILMLTLAVRLFIITVPQRNVWIEEASKQSVRKIYYSAPRGRILDRNGKVIATNKQVFAVTFNSSGMETEQINDSIYKLIKVLEKNKDEIKDNFPIKIGKDNNFYYSYQKDTEDWLKKHGLDMKLSAYDAFKQLRIKYRIDDNLDRYEALEVLQQEHNVYPPIYVKKMKYTNDIELETFWGKFGFYQDEIDKGIDAKKAFLQLLKDFNIDKNLDYNEARKIFVIRNEIATMSYSRYISIQVATDVSDNTIAYLEEAAIPGVEIVSQTQRYYPNKSLASHIVGYMGSISESEAEHYVGELGYSASDLIGKDGIESAYESTLKGVSGSKKISVNSSGQYIETINEVEPEKGKDVFLTIDMELQKVAEDSLKRMIKVTNSGGVFKSKYGNMGAGRYPKCKSGAVVALDVKTGEVLAMASAPDYDLNLFSKGISQKAWSSVQAENPRDYLSATPLYNNATKASVQPGSTFKPLTSVTALECGLDPNRFIYDKGYIQVGDRKFGCSAYNDYGGSHGSVDMEHGIGYSCNYYFYCIGSGKDYASGQSLGYTEKISVDKIMSVAKEFGLGRPTGIEIDEVVTPLASADNKMENQRIMLWNQLYSDALTFFPKKIANNYKELVKEIDIISNWIYDNPERDELITLIAENTKVKKSQVENVADICKYSYFNQAKWNLGDEFNISIGQGDNAYTPVQMANYIATLANKGYKNEVSVVKGVEGQGEKEKPAAVKLNLKNRDKLGAVIKGMEKVASGGTLSGVFGNFPVKVGGKTGTAEKQGYINPKDEVAYVKKHLSSLTRSVSWKEVEKMMDKLMEEEPDNYIDENSTVDMALVKASEGKVTQAMINQYKDTYDNFAWTVTMAPSDDPEIVVVAMLVQGGISFNAAPIAREVIGKYLLEEKNYSNVKLDDIIR